MLDFYPVTEERIARHCNVIPNTQEAEAGFWSSSYIARDYLEKKEIVD